jgi:hypothetical protein
MVGLDFPSDFLLGARAPSPARWDTYLVKESLLVPSRCGLGRPRSQCGLEIVQFQTDPGQVTEGFRPSEPTGYCPKRDDLSEAKNLS